MCQTNGKYYKGKFCKALFGLLAASQILVAGCAGFLSGKSVQLATIQITPSNLNFGNVALGRKVSQSLSVKNTGPATINITAATLTSPQFTISGVTFPFSLVAGSTANLSVSFSGSAKGAASGTLILKTDTGSISAPVTMSAMATVAGAQLTASPSTVSFGSVTTGTSASSPVTLTNTGSSDLTISVITVNGAPFGVSGLTTPTTISTGQSAILNVTYSPTSTIGDSGSISITSNDPASPTTIGLSGTGTTTPVGRLSLNPPRLSFGNVTVGKTSTLSSTLTNTGQATVHISAVSAPGSGFTASGVSAGTTLAKGQSAALQVLFAPASAGAASSSISITSDASGTLVPLSLSGTAVTGTGAPTISIASPASGSIVSGTVTITASASSAAGVTYVQYQLDGINLSSFVTTSPYVFSWDTTKTNNGSHTLKAIVTDGASQQATSSPVTVTVNNTPVNSNQPTVSFISPLAGTTVSGTITVTATASDSHGVANVQFQVDGANLGGSNSSAPYSQSWNTTKVADGPHTLRAVATSNDSAEQQGIASTVVIVNNSGTGPSLSSAAGWHKIPSTALCGGGTEGNAPFTDPDNFPSNLNSGFASYGFGFTSQCYNILEDSNSGAYDTLRHRLIMYGGGHQHYWGNDVFSLELSLVNTSAPTPMFHLDHSADPLTCPASGPASSTVTESNGAICTYNSSGVLSTVLGLPGCSYVAGCTPTKTTTPSSVHTYNTTVYIPGFDEMTVFGGATAPNGNAGQDAWLLSMGSLIPSCAPNTTTNQQGCNPSWTPIGNPALNNAYLNTFGVGAMAAYDPNTSGVWTQNQSGLEWFNPANNTLTVESTTGVGYHSTAVLDPVDKYLILIGPQSTSPTEGLLYINIACSNAPTCAGSNFTINRPNATGCANLIGGSNTNPQYMGAQWDPIGQRVAVYPNTGNAIWYINPKTWTCTSETYGSAQGTDYPQNTPLPSGDAGTFGHFQYDPELDVFVLCNDPHNDCWYLRLNRSSSGGGTSGPSVSVSSPSNGATVSGTVTISATASDSAGITGVQFQVDGTNIGGLLTTAPYSLSWDTTGTSNGVHSLRATAQDGAGKTAVSAAVAVTVSNTVTTPPPSVSITSPISGATVSGTTTVSASASSSVGIANVQFLLDGANLGAAQTSSPYSVSWDTTTANNGTHILAATATDNSGHTGTSSSVSVIVSQSTPPPPPVGDDVTISDASGSGQTNRAISVSRAFIQGEIANFAQASINGAPLLTQCDVKNRWPDGSLKFAIVSFVIPTIPANGSVVVSFSNQGSGNNTGFLAQSDMLNSTYNFDGQIRVTGAASHTISARAVLNAAGSCSDPGSDPDGGQFKCTYWLKGPVVTAVILEDRLGRSFDVNTDNGAGNPLHPIFEAWFYPQGNLVQLGYTLENSWASATASDSARDQTYSVVLTGGNANPTTVFTNGSFTHITRSRWHRSFCVNGAGVGSAYSCGPAVAVNHNWPYLAETKFTPHWDPNLTIAASKITSEVNGFAGTNQGLSGNANGIGYYPGPNQGGMNATGAAEYHGPLTTWDIVTLMSQNPRMFPVTLGNADLGNALPYFYREADANAGHGQTFDNSGIPGNVQPQGRIVSINARTQVSLLDTTVQNCNFSFAPDWINFGGSGQDAGVWGTGQLDTSHWPNLAYASYLLTGQYAYYEEQLMQSAYALAASPGSRACAQNTGNSALRMGSAGYWYIDQERGQDWMARENFLGAFIAVDGSPEKGYLEDKLRANLAVWEGVHQIPNDIGLAYSVAWLYGNVTRITNPSAAGTPLGAWTHGPAVGPNGYAANYPLCLGNTASPCPATQFAGSPGDANSNFQNAYSAVIIGWINDLGYCPGNCALLGFVANHFINEAMNPASNIFHLSDYVFPTLDSNGNEITSWAQDQAFYVPGGQASHWPACGAQHPDEWYTAEDMSAMSYFYTMTSSQGGYSGASAYNKLRSAQNALGCTTNSPGADFPTVSPKWDITPRATNPPPAP